jgi:molybdopterin-guanine dinucleotide biosynthesis protein A
MGIDKAFLDFAGRTLLERALQLARSITDQVSIVGSRDKFGQYGPVVEDIFRNCGPLAGIHAGLRGSPTDLNLFLAVDMPLVSPQPLRYLIALAESSPEAKAVVPRWEGRLHPLCAIYRRELCIAAEAALRAGRNKIAELFEGQRIRVIEQEELQRQGFSSAMFCNLNTLEELEEARQARENCRVGC